MIVSRSSVFFQKQNHDSKKLKKKLNFKKSDSVIFRPSINFDASESEREMKPQYLVFGRSTTLKNFPQPRPEYYTRDVRNFFPKGREKLLIFSELSAVELRAKEYSKDNPGKHLPIFVITLKEKAQEKLESEKNIKLKLHLGYPIQKKDVQKNDIHLIKPAYLQHIEEEDSLLQTSESFSEHDDGILIAPRKR